MARVVPIDERKQRRARREGRVTYGPLSAVLLTGFAGGLAAMLTPVFVWLVVGLVAWVGEALRYGTPGAGVTVLQANLHRGAQYIAACWAFLVGGGAVGAVMAFLRRRWGFAHREVAWHPYGRHPRLPAAPHELLAYVAGPVMLALMAWTFDPRLYFRLLSANFMFWLLSGAYGLVVWRVVQDLLLTWWPEPDRRLDLEYAIRSLFNADPALAPHRIERIHVSAADLRVRIGTSVTDPFLHRRMRELVGRLEGFGEVIVEVEGASPAAGSRVVSTSPPSAGAAGERAAG